MILSACAILGGALSLANGARWHDDFVIFMGCVTIAWIAARISQRGLSLK
jgi:hypothetical protein